MAKYCIGPVGGCDRVDGLSAAAVKKNSVLYLFDRVIPFASAAAALCGTGRKPNNI